MAMFKDRRTQSAHAHSISILYHILKHYTYEMKLGGAGGGEACGAFRSCDDGTAAGPAGDDGTAGAAANDISQCSRWCPDVYGRGLGLVGDRTNSTTAARQGQTHTFCHTFQLQIGFSSDFR